MKVVLATPNFHQSRGNTVTAQRIANNLEKLGVQTEIISTTEEFFPDSFPPADIVHGFNAYRFYKFMQKSGKKLDPYIVTLTGTDLNHDLFDDEKRDGVITSLNGAKAIHVFDQKAKNILITEVPKLKHKTFTLAQGNSDFPVSNSLIEKEEDTFLFVLPAGIRKVKNIPTAITMLGKLHERQPPIKLWLVGPILEKDEGKVILELVEKNKDWIKYIGQLPHSSMGSIYDKADIVLNTSHAEGQPSAIIEAMGFGIPVLVSNITGNSSIVSHNKTGFLYGDENEFLDYTESIMNNYDEVKQKIGLLAKQYIAERHSGTKEAKAFLNVYKSIVK